MTDVKDSTASAYTEPSGDTAQNGRAIPTNGHAHEPGAIAEAWAALARGWQPIPMQLRTKKLMFPGEPPTLDAGNFEQYFDPAYDGQYNVGVRMGEPSSGLVDIDLDDPGAVELAPQFLPPTGMTFGRAGKRRSHWLYQVEGALPPSKEFKDPTKVDDDGTPRQNAMLVEFRATNRTTVWPGPSTPRPESRCSGRRPASRRGWTGLSSWLRRRGWRRRCWWCGTTPIPAAEMR